ncbi:hypothetical protein NEPAR04_2219 [Nematocida parisii]|nr:hypothetical protein NEPAR04_2219 [Nematocida parisii]
MRSRSVQKRKKQRRSRRARCTPGVQAHAQAQKQKQYSGRTCRHRHDMERRRSCGGTCSAEKTHAREGHTRSRHTRNKKEVCRNGQNRTGKHRKDRAGTCSCKDVQQSSGLQECVRRDRAGTCREEQSRCMQNRAGTCCEDALWAWAVCVRSRKEQRRTAAEPALVCWSEKRKEDTQQSGAREEAEGWSGGTCCREEVEHKWAEQSRGCKHLESRAEQSRTGQLRAGAGQRRHAQ